MTLLLSGVARCAEDGLCDQQDLSVPHILSASGHDKKQYQALIDLLLEQRALSIDASPVIDAFAACAVRFAVEHPDFEKLSAYVQGDELHMRYADRSATIKKSRLASLPSLVNKSLSSLHIRDEKFSSSLWFLWTEAALAATHQKFNSYIYVDQLETSDAIGSGLSQSVGFLPSLHDNLMRVRKVIDPALIKAGLSAGDLVKSLSSESVDPEGLSAWWTQERPFTYSLVFARQGKDIPGIYQSVPFIHTSAYALAIKKIKYIRIDFFSERTDIEFSRLMRDIDSYSAIVLDLRNNGGGVVSPGVIDYFVKPAQLTLVYRERNGPLVRRPGSMVYVDKPIAILINAESASMSEIAAAMLQSQKRAIVIGQNSFGKAVGQTKMGVGKEGEILLVNHEYFYADGKSNWMNNGVVPDIPVKISPEESDKVTDALLEDKVNLDELIGFDSVLNTALHTLGE